MAIRGGFTNSGRTKRVKYKGEGERLIQSNAESQETARRDKEAFFNEQCLIIEENNKREGLEISSGEGNGTPLQCSCLENPMDGGAW